MNHHDGMDQLRAANPFAESDLSRTDPRALGALRDGISMMDRESTASRTQRHWTLGRRGLVAGVLGVGLVSGGVAYATYTQRYTGGGLDGLTCQQHWVDPTTADSAAFDRASSGGPALTGDPVADCEQYQKLSGRPAIDNAAAFRYNGSIYVAPRSQVPAAGVLLHEAPTLGAAQRELAASLGDWVDGMRSRCFSEGEAKTFARGELVRLGLGSWTIKVIGADGDQSGPADSKPAQTLGPSPSPTGTDKGSLSADPIVAGSPDAFRCAGASVDAEHQTVLVLPNRSADPNRVQPASAVDPLVYQVRDALRRDVAAKCLTLSQAQAVARRAMNGQPLWPLTTVTDKSVRCARADMEVGGNIQVTLYGPGAPAS